MTHKSTSPTVFGQQCSEKFVTVLSSRPFGAQHQSKTPAQSPEQPYVVNTPVVEVVVHPPTTNVTPKNTSGVKQVTASLEKDKTKLTSIPTQAGFEISRTPNHQLYTVRQGIGGLVIIPSPTCHKGTAPSMQSTPIHAPKISSPSYSFPGLSPFASYTTPISSNIFDDSLLKESPDLEMLSEIALQTGPVVAPATTLQNSTEEVEVDANQSQLRGKHVPCILRKRKSAEFDASSSSIPTDDRRTLEEISTSQLTFSPSMLLNSPLVRHQHSSGKKRRRRQKSSETAISYLAPYASTPIRDTTSSTTFSPLTKSHDVPYDSGYITKIEPGSPELIVYGSPPPQMYHSRLYDQENNETFRRPSFYNSDDPDWEPYDEGLMPTRKSKPSPTGSALKPVKPSEVFRDCRDISSEEFLHRYVLVQAIEKAKSGHYVKKSRFAPDWARFVYGLTEDQIQMTALAKQFLLKTQSKFL